MVDGHIPWVLEGHIRGGREPHTVVVVGHIATTAVEGHKAW